jgi:hypothetical protein
MNPVGSLVLPRQPLEEEPIQAPVSFNHFERLSRIPQFTEAQRLLTIWRALVKQAATVSGTFNCLLYDTNSRVGGGTSRARVRFSVTDS